MSPTQIVLKNTVDLLALAAASPMPTNDFFGIRSYVVGNNPKYL